jgi:GNAT superfamily N-acetyltransferase
MPRDRPPELTFAPLTPDRWGDFEAVMGQLGGYGNCWCMWWRSRRSEFDAGARERGAGNRRSMRAIVDSSEPPGILAYAKGEPIAWCSIAPRETYGALERSRNLRRIDEQPVWSVVCFVIAKEHRGRGIVLPLLKAAVEHARARGARIVEGYPIPPKAGGRLASGTTDYMGVPKVFERAGFKAVRPAGRHLVMRRSIRPRRDDRPL